MDTWVFFGGRWKLIEERWRVWYIILLCVLSALIGAGAGWLRGAYWAWHFTDQLWTARVTAIESQMYDLTKRSKELEKDYAPMMKVCQATEAVQKDATGRKR